MATETTKLVGTSLEVLAPYLPYGIEVQSLFTDSSENRRYLFRGWRHKELSPYCVECTWMLPDPEMNTAYEAPMWLPVDKCLPILRPFSALCDELPDGTTPAIEIAKFYSVSEAEDWDKLRVKHWPVSKYIKKEHIDVTKPLGSGMSALFLEITQGWRFRAGGREEQVEIARVIDYLRSKHFAVGLEPHQYIASPSGDFPTIERGAGRE